MNDKTKQSFISAVRREQIIEAAIQTLDEIGYVKASLAQIAKRAGISTALISYHFKDKSDLMNHLLANLFEGLKTYILDRVQQESTYERKIETFISSSLAYQMKHPERKTAMLEIIFNARTPDHVPYYKLNHEEDDEDPIVDELKSVLHGGQEEGVFGRFNIDVMANMIQGAIEEYTYHAVITKQLHWEAYSTELIRIVKQALQGY